MTQKEKFEEAKRLYGTANADQRYVLESLFPELKESEDERVRKEIISAIKEDWPGHTDWIAWIEKQEQKPAELAKGEDYGIDGLYAAIDILQQTLGKVDGYQSDDGILEHKCAISAVKQLYEQKPVAWSEEDKRKIDRIYSILRQASDTHAFSTSCRLIGDKECIELQDFLKSLRPQSQWKPSDEQMKILNEVLNFAANHKSPHWNDYLFGTLNNLIRQLKKLRDE